MDPPPPLPSLSTRKKMANAIEFIENDNITNFISIPQELDYSILNEKRQTKSRIDKLQKNLLLKERENINFEIMNKNLKFEIEIISSAFLLQQKLLSCVINNN